MSELQISVIAPCYNEESNLAELTRRVLATFERGGIDGELILVDDGSSDKTADRIRELEEKYPDKVIGRFHGVNRGMAQAWKTGAVAARAPVVAVIDADLQYQPEDLLRLHRELIEHSVDVVQGFRSPVGRARGARYNLSRGLNFLLNTTFNMSLRDNKSGFVMCAKEVMLDLLNYSGAYYYWQSFIMVAAHAKGYTYREVETLFEDRRAGTSFLEGQAYRASAKALVDLAAAAKEYRFGQRAADVSEQFLSRKSALDRTPASPLPRRAHWKAYLSVFDQTHWMITKDVERYYDLLNKTQWLSPSDVKELQDEKLRRLVRHAYRDVPYYREKMKAAGIRPEDIRGQADLHKLPYLTKNDVREHLHFDILSTTHDKNKVLKISTSGSTGEPFVCYADKAQLEFRWAATLRSQEWTGYRFGDPCVRLWHQTIGMNKSQEMKERLDAALTRRTFIPVFEMNDAGLESMIRTVEAARPVLVDGYAEAFDFIAQYLKRRPGGMKIKPKALMTSAQTLPDASRKLIEDAFGCKVFDKYGSREFSGIAYECEAHTGHHVVGEGYIVEVLKGGEPAKAGEAGEVVITDLNNYCLPFIRYRIGDLAVAKDPGYACPCGRGLPVLGAIEGRVQSIIVGTDGRYVPGTFFAHLLKEYDHAIRLFQVEQERPGHMYFRVVKGGRYSDDVLQQILQVFKQYLGDIEVDVQFVENVELIRTGKRMASVSKLKVDFQARPLERAAE